MTHALEEIDRLRPLDPEALARAEEQLLDHIRAYQLKELRASLDLTQAELAERMQVGQNRVSQIESGGAEWSRLETLRRYAHALGGTLSVEIAIGDRKYVVA